MKYRVIIPREMKPMPAEFELTAAGILAGFFQSDVEFILVSSDKTPDILVGNVRWEIKSPIGNGKRNIQHQFNRAMKQSKNIVFDARRSKMDVRKIRKELKRQAQMTRELKRLVFITKEGKVEVIK